MMRHRPGTRPPHAAGSPYPALLGLENGSGFSDTACSGIVGADGVGIRGTSVDDCSRQASELVDEPDDIILRYLRRIDEGLGRVEERLANVVARLIRIAGEGMGVLMFTQHTTIRCSPQS